MPERHARARGERQPAENHLRGRRLLQRERALELAQNAANELLDGNLNKSGAVRLRAAAEIDRARYPPVSLRARTANVANQSTVCRLQQIE